MQPRTTALLLVAALALGAFVYFWELGGEGARLDAEERGKRLFTGIEVEDVEWITLQTRDGVEARMERGEGGWRLVEPLTWPADDAVERMAESLTTLSHESTFDPQEDDAQYGLDDAGARIVRFGAEGESHELRLGRDTPLGSDLYARAGSSGPVHIVARHRTTGFDRALLDLRDKQVLDFDPSAVSGFEASWPGGRVVVARDEATADDEESEDVPATWSLEVPLEVRADDETVDRLLSTLAFLRADGFSDEPGDAQQGLLDPPDFSVALTLDGGEGPLSLSLSVSRPDEEDRRWVRTDGSVLFEIPGERIADLPRETLSYRYRTLASFPLSEAQEVDFRFAAEGVDPVEIHAEHGGVGWTSEPEPFAPGKLPRLVSELSRLEADAVLAEAMGSDELEGVGLSPPRAIVTVRGGGEDADDDANLATLAELHLGEVTPEGVVARRAGEPTVYRLSLEVTEHVPVSLATFRDRFRAESEEDVEPPLGAEPTEELLDPSAESP